jgi:hypothetical protein
MSGDHTARDSRSRRMSKADETIKEAVKESIGVLTEHIQPGERDCEATVNKVTEILDNPVVEKALEESDSARDDAREAALSQKENRSDYPKTGTNKG